MKHTRAYEMAKKYYPRLWSLETLKELLAAGKLRQDEFDELTGRNKEAENERSISDNSISTPNPQGTVGTK